MIRTDQEAHLYLKKNVSRETFEKLSLYHDTLIKWNKAINLVSASTLKNIWLRHILDSYQIASKITGEFADLGSGAGFPGLVCSITTHYKSYLIEADTKKASFLRNVSRETLAPCEIIEERIESIQNSFQEFTSRALTSIFHILNITQHLRIFSSKYILLKSHHVDREIEEAQRKWDFEIKKTPSITQPQSYIIEISHIREKQ